MEWEPVIGLECHVQLATRTKLFSRARAAFGAAPNSQTDPYTLALPGTLPVPQGAAIELAIRMGLATGCRIRELSRFARKHYFYPDLPKGYQISQFDEPLCEGGEVELSVDPKSPETRRVKLTRIHVEEDAGKSTHGEGGTLIDLNRAGVPLIEIVSEPELRSAEEAGAYVRAVRQLVRWLEISDGNMEEGSLRCDANVSVRPRGETKLGTKVEIKNLNSFKHVEDAIADQVKRQIGMLEREERIEQVTVGWHPLAGAPFLMRSKEEAHDYRYFPEPDLPPLKVTAARVAEIREQLPELPMARRARYMEKLGLSAYDGAVLTAERAIADYFDAVVAQAAPAKLAANWISSELLGRLNQSGMAIAESPIAPARLAELIALVVDETISGKIAKDVFDRMWKGPERGARAIVKAEGLEQVTDTGAIEAACRAVVAANPKQAADFRAGKTQMLGFFVGQVMKATQGKANPALANATLKKLLEGGS